MSKQVANVLIETLPITEIDRPEEDEAKRAKLATDRILPSLRKTVPVLMWSTAPDGKVSYINQRMVDYTGRTLKHLVSLGWKDLIHPDDQDETVEAGTNAVKDGSSYQLRLRLLGANGEYRRFLVQAAPLLDSEGRVTQLFGLNVDIDETTRVTEALGHAQNKLALTVGVPAAQTFPTLFREAEIALGTDTKRCDETKHSDVRLSAREHTIVRLMGQGLSNKTIARQLSIAPETVKSHAKNIFWKLTVRTRAEAVYRAAALGLI